MWFKFPWYPCINPGSTSDFLNHFLLELSVNSPPFSHLTFLPPFLTPLKINSQMLWERRLHQHTIFCKWGRKQMVIMEIKTLHLQQQKMFLSSQLFLQLIVRAWYQKKRWEVCLFDFYFTASKISWSLKDIFFNGLIPSPYQMVGWFFSNFRWMGSVDYFFFLKTKNTRNDLYCNLHHQHLYCITFTFSWIYNL